MPAKFYQQAEGRRRGGFPSSALTFKVGFFKKTRTALSRKFWLSLSWRHFKLQACGRHETWCIPFLIACASSYQMYTGTAWAQKSSIKETKSNFEFGLLCCRKRKCTESHAGRWISEQGSALKQPNGQFMVHQSSKWADFYSIPHSLQKSSGQPVWLSSLSILSHMI